MKEFKLHSPFKPLGDQPKAIKSLVDGVNKGMHEQTLLGVTGSGKTFTMANIIEEVQKPTLIISHNKTLAAQLYEEFKAFFPENAVEYFVSYYDFYQPEAYVPSSDTFIDKESSINEDIDIMRHSATQSLLSRDDVIVVSSVSCIYGIGSPQDYGEFAFGIEVGDEFDRAYILWKYGSKHNLLNSSFLFLISSSDKEFPLKDIASVLISIGLNEKIFPISLIACFAPIVW